MLNYITYCRHYGFLLRVVLVSQTLIPSELGKFTFHAALNSDTASDVASTELYQHSACWLSVNVV